MNEELASVLQQLRAGLAAMYGERLERVLLYGSQARGDARADSDVDVLVVLTGDVNPMAEIRRTGELVADLSLEHNLVLTCLFMSADEFAEEDDPFLRNVRREALPA